MYVWGLLLRNQDLAVKVVTSIEIYKKWFMSKNHIKIRWSDIIIPLM